MDKLVLGSIFIWTLFVTLRWGLSRTLAYAYLPAMLFFFLVPPVSLPGIPNLTSATAVGYAASAALLVRYRDLKVIKFNAIDALVLLMLIPPAISVGINTGAWDSISQTGELFFRWILPYFLARVALPDPVARRHTLWVLCICAILIGFMAAYEARLSPYFVSRQLKARGLSAIIGNQQVLYRYGLARALVTMGQPIDLGVCGVLVGTMILILTPASGYRIWNRLPLIGLCGAGGMVLFSVSFTAWVAMVVAFGAYAVLSWRKWGAYLTVPMMLALMGSMVYLTDVLLNEQVPYNRPEGDPAELSKWIRVRIVQDSWPIVMESGWFGLGRYGVPVESIGVGSVDNAYLLFIMLNGWTYLVLWGVLALVIAIKGARALSRAADVPTMRYPMAAALAGTMAVFFAMYTVYYGFVYAVLLCVVFGMLASMTQLFAAYSRATVLPGPQPVMPIHLGTPAAGTIR